LLIPAAVLYQDGLPIITLDGFAFKLQGHARAAGNETVQ